MSQKQQKSVPSTKPNAKMPSTVEPLDTANRLLYELRTSLTLIRAAGRSAEDAGFDEGDVVDAMVAEADHAFNLVIEAENTMDRLRIAGAR